MPIGTRVFYTPRVNPIHPQDLRSSSDYTRDQVRPRGVYGRSPAPQPGLPSLEDIEAVERYFMEEPVGPPPAEWRTMPRQDRCDRPQGEGEIDDTPFTPINQEAYLKAKEEAHEFSIY